MTARLQTLIGGRWRDGSGPLYSTEYPADGSVVAELHAASLADVDEAVQTAEAARHRPNWAGLKPHQRALLLHRMAAGIRDRAEELAQLQRLDNGKPVSETRALVASAAGTFQYFAAACETLEDQVTPARACFQLNQGSLLRQVGRDESNLPQQLIRHSTGNQAISNQQFARLHRVNRRQPHRPLFGQWEAIEAN